MAYKDLQTYFGKNALRAYLNPAESMTPLVELPEYLNPFYKDGVRVYAKMMNMLPLGNIKSLPAFHMLKSAQMAGSLSQVKEIVENSSGNTAYSLAVLGRLFGIPHTTALVSHEISRGKLMALQLFGVHVEVNAEDICPDPNDPASGVQKAKLYAATDPRKINLGQYHNPANPRAHEMVTGPQIWKQLHGAVDVFCAGLGTTGTLLGAGAYLKRKCKRVQIVGVARLPNNPVPGVRTENLLKQVEFPWRSAADSVELVGTREAYTHSMRLCRAGLLAGPSSGFALAGLYSHLQTLKNTGKLGSRSRRLTHAVFVCPDGPFAYLEEYAAFVDSAEFPPITNGHLLQEKNGIPRSDKKFHSGIECSVQELLLRAYRVSDPQATALVPHADAVIVDVRTKQEFEDHHLPGSKHIPLQELLLRSVYYVRKYRKKQIYLICRSGHRSMLAAQALRANGANHAWSVCGGLIQWSATGAERVQPDSCTRKNAERVL